MDFAFIVLSGCTPKPWEGDYVIVENTNITNVDLTSFKGCVWNEKDREITITQPRFSFGFDRAGSYYVCSGNTNRKPENSEYGGCGTLSTKGEALGNSNELTVRPAPRPDSSNFLRPLRH